MKLRDEKVKSLIVRRITFILFFFFLLPLSIFIHYPVIEGEITIFAHIIGLVIIIVTAVFAVYVHSLFPKRHIGPEDFDHLLTDGPYRYVRHPFYASFIVMGFGIGIFFLSIPGIIFNILMIPMWIKLTKMEEKELLEYWGDEYKQFMDSRPRFFPRIFRRSKSKEDSRKNH